MSNIEIPNDEISRDTAAEVFAQHVAQSLKVDHDSFLEALSSGIPPNLFGSLSVWYHSLDENGRIQAAELVWQAMHSALFGIMTMFDGVAGTPRIDEKPVNFALSLDVYPNFDAYLENEVVSRTRINTPMQKEPLLHDLFQDFTDDA